MKLKFYENILYDIRKFSGLTRDCAEMLIQKYPNIPVNSIHSILSIEVINRVKKSGYKGHGTQRKFWERWKKSQQNGESSGIIIRLSAMTNLPPSLVARSILEYYYQSIDRNVTKANVYQYLKDPTLIDNQDLAYEIYLSILYDDRDGPVSQAFSKAIGYEYESELQNYLVKRGIAYITEDNLRRKGYDKTPDIKLEIPIAIDGFVVNWIESKARFGSPSIHATYLKSQLLSYWNRFGPGLVIYWFDYVDEIIEPNEKRFIIMNHFPNNVTYMHTDISE
ncbi:protein C15orf41 homolog isoform X2 [Chelonus insularis]|uniref:protein C15orf41 homolog isoform X2 n=1 Tax=Chelonus insularis TaxID=460826 RepID=UPI00158920CC|nr:protein C15orf41 homolog isoform X2 [Chelonus insularis]